MSGYGAWVKTPTVSAEPSIARRPLRSPAAIAKYIVRVDPAFDDVVSAAGPFEKIRPTAQAVAHISQIATLSAAAGKAACQNTGDKRDLGVARQCSNVFGAALVSVEETD